jgi:D-sedoheptulose 7-phosphate isomerase
LVLAQTKALDRILAESAPTRRAYKEVRVNEAVAPHNGNGCITCGQEYFLTLARVVENIPTELIDEISDAILRAHYQDRAVFLFGNGGSASLASHFACDLGKGTALPGSNKRLRVVALTDNIALITAWANDKSYEDIFAEQLRNLVRPRDISIAVSATGNSPNVLKALNISRQMGGFNIGLTGFDGGKLRALCDLCLVVPSNNMQLIEDLHLSVAHSIFTIVRYQMSMASSHAYASLTGT